MFPAMPAQGTKQERQLLKLFNHLNDANKASLLAFATFLQSHSMDGDVKDENTQVVISEPLDIPRPEAEESVIKAIKRLSETYPMVDKETILHPISDLMTAHMIQGKPAVEVIDELEVVFHQQYQSLRQQNNENKSA